MIAYLPNCDLHTTTHSNTRPFVYVISITDCVTCQTNSSSFQIPFIANADRGSCPEDLPWGVPRSREKERLKRLAELAAWTHQAIEEFRKAVLQSRALPTAPIQKQPRPVEHKHLHVRKLSKRRVCSGASRYRVMAN
jgi:hypothetical protein